MTARGDNFMNRIKELRTKKGMSQAELAKRCSVHQTAVSQWENGRTYPDTESLIRLAGVFNVSIDELMSDESNTAGKVRIPVLGYIRAGIPLEAVKEILDYEEIPSDMPLRGEYFALKIRGDSMEPRICDGDVVIVRQQQDVESGEIAVVMVNGTDATVKKVIKKDTRLILVPFNPNYEPIVFSKKEVLQLPVKIIGKVVELRGKF
jgi:repressor LexA